MVMAPAAAPLVLVHFAKLDQMWVGGIKFGLISLFLEFHSISVSESPKSGLEEEEYLLLNMFPVKDTFRCQKCNFGD